MKEGALESLKGLKERLLVLQNDYGVEQEFNWKNPGSLIDYGQGG